MTYLKALLCVAVALMAMGAAAKEHDKDYSYLALGIGSGHEHFEGIDSGDALLLNGRIGRTMYLGEWTLSEEIQTEGSVGSAFGVRISPMTTLSIDLVAFTVNTVLATPPLIDLPVVGDTSLYALGGLGFLHASLDTNAISSLTSLTDVDFAGRVGGGVRFDAGEKFDLTLEASRVFGTGSVSGLDYTSVTGNIIWRW